MKILSISAQKPHSTGSGTYLSELVRSFDALGHRQIVVCGVYPDDRIDMPQAVSFRPVYFSDTSDDGAKFERGLMHPGTPESAEHNSSPHISYPIAGMSDVMPYTSTLYSNMTEAMSEEFETSFISVIQRAVTDLDPDLILCHHLFLLTSLVRKHFPGRLIYGISHSTDLRQMNNCPNLSDKIKPYIYDLDMVLALHDEQASRISEIFGIEPSRIKVIGSGYNHRRFNTFDRKARLPGDPVTISYVGKISKAKGVPELLRALERLSHDPEVPKFRLTMAGGCTDDELMPLLGKLPDYADWVGFIPSDDLSNLFKSSDIFILPSYYEGLPLVIMESMASGAIPICTDLPGVRKWIDSHVANSPVRYIPMPEMSTIDVPSEAGRIRFVNDLSRIIKATVNDVYRRNVPVTTPDTGKITWDAVALAILTEI